MVSSGSPYVDRMSPNVLTAERHTRNSAVLADLRAHQGRTTNGQILVIITVIGQKTGRRYELPLCVVTDGDDLIIAASAGGQPAHPEWYANLLATPNVTVEYLGRTFTSRAELIANGGDRDRLVDRLSGEITGLYEYQDKCRDTRQIPMIRLVPQKPSE